MTVKNKVAIVTGASFGIGEATARLLSEKGAKVALVARSIEKLEKLSKVLPDSIAIQTDMSDEKQVVEMVRKVFKQFGKIDILVNNAGRGYDSNLEEIDTGLFRELIELNLIGPLVAMKEVILVMKKQGGGSIVNISSGTALMNLPGMSPYSSLKKALVGFSLTAREELQDSKIRVSVVYPYVTFTDFEKNTLKNSDAEEDFEMDYSRLPHPPDSAGHAAEKIIEAIETGASEIYAHDWMKSRT